MNRKYKGWVMCVTNQVDTKATRCTDPILNGDIKFNIKTIFDSIESHNEFVEKSIKVKRTMIIVYNGLNTE